MLPMQTVNIRLNTLATVLLDSVSLGEQPDGGLPATRHGCSVEERMPGVMRNFTMLRTPRSTRYRQDGGTRGKRQTAAPIDEDAIFRNYTAVDLSS